MISRISSVNGCGTDVTGHIHDQTLKIPVSAGAHLSRRRHFSLLHEDLDHTRQDGSGIEKGEVGTDRKTESRETVVVTFLISVWRSMILK